MAVFENSPIHTSTGGNEYGLLKPVLPHLILPCVT